MSVTMQDFKYALSGFPSGVTVVTYNKDGVDSGITVSAFSSLSLDPPLILICLNHTSPAISAIESSKGFTIHILKSNQAEVSNTFAKPDDSRIEYLAQNSIKRGETGAAHIPGVLSLLDCSLYSSMDGGDHKIIIGKVEACFTEEPITENIQPLVYFNRNYRTTKDI